MNGKKIDEHFMNGELDKFLKILAIEITSSTGIKGTPIPRCADTLEYRYMFKNFTDIENFYNQVIKND